MTLLSFTLPPDSGEKLTLGVTILLSMIVSIDNTCSYCSNMSYAIPGVSHAIGRNHAW